MKKFKSVFLLAMASILLCSLFTQDSPARIYKYKDENGNWYFTDTPISDSKEMQLIEESPEKKTPQINLVEELYQELKPKNDIERASVATVCIKSRFGKGSGFFISGKGYIITNKHVIRGSDINVNRTNAYIKKTEEQIKEIGRKLDLEEKQLKKTKKQLKEYKEAIDEIRDASARNVEYTKYEMGLERYKAWEEDFQRRHREYQTKKEDFDKKKKDFEYMTNMARTDRYFKITLKNKTELDVRLINVSREYDLALLKLNDHKTPFLKPGNSVNMAQGKRVFAIGCPAGLSDSVTSGVISGFENNYIKTNAHIYPGNSGGPLINHEGEVIGVNTLKKLTHKFEGLGFAIPIETAFREFRSYLK